MKRVLALIPLCGLIFGCGGNGSVSNTASRANAVLITLKADGGRTICLGYRFDDETTDTETRIGVPGDRDVVVTGLYGSGVTPILHLRGFESATAVAWTRDIPLSGTDGESVVVDPNE